MAWTRSLTGVTLALTAVTGMASPAIAQQKTHRIDAEADPTKDVYRFSPDEVNAKPGDVIVFRVKSGAPHGVVFESKGLSAATKQALNAAMPSRSGNLSSPLLTRNGAEYRITLPSNLPAGTYEFYCLPHRAYDMRGRIRVSR